uniref:Uncharacterized protein LOC114342966 n=1 Tax=Diabrotica virgifera virgifera TaxID=50390 RepID=A0A6P7H0K4_DIAVI
MSQENSFRTILRCLLFRFVIRTTKEKSLQPTTSSSVDPVEFSQPESESESEITRESSSDSPKLDSKEVQPKKKRKLYDVKYKSNWTTEFKWLKNVEGKAYCGCCKKSLAGGRKHLERHENSEFHKINKNKIRGSQAINVALQNVPSQKLGQ